MSSPGSNSSSTADFLVLAKSISAFWCLLASPNIQKLNPQTWLPEGLEHTFSQNRSINTSPGLLSKSPFLWRCLPQLLMAEDLHGNVMVWYILIFRQLLQTAGDFGFSFFLILYLEPALQDAPRDMCISTWAESTIKHRIWGSLGMTHAPGLVQGV